MNRGMAFNAQGYGVEGTPSWLTAGEMTESPFKQAFSAKGAVRTGKAMRCVQHRPSLC